MEINNKEEAAIFRKIKNLLKKRNNRFMLVIFIIGIAIIAISGVISGDKREQPSADNVREEERLGEVLSQIEGAGRVSVMLSYEEPVRESGISYTGERAAAYPRVRGVIIIADGADEPGVRLALREAAAAVTGAAANHVCVYGRGQ